MARIPAPTQAPNGSTTPRPKPRQLRPSWRSSFQAARSSTGSREVKGIAVRVSTPPATTNSTGQTEQGTSGSSISNNSSTSLNSSEFLNLMMDELENQNPLDPPSSDPTQYLTELGQMTSVEQGAGPAPNPQGPPRAPPVSQAVGLIGDAVS